MRKIISGTVAALTAMASVLSAAPAAAQSRWDRNGNGVPDYREYRDRDYNHSDNYRGWHRYGAAYGYDGYNGRWRTGQRFSHWNDDRYYVNDWGRYDLPPPRRGYRYYRDDNGDIVMAAIGSGIIGMILGSALSDNHHYRW